MDRAKWPFSGPKWAGILDVNFPMIWPRMQLRRGDPTPEDRRKFRQMASACPSTMHLWGVRSLLTTLLFLTCCQHLRLNPAEKNGMEKGGIASGAALTAVDFSNPAAPAAMDLPLQIPAAKNEWTNFVVQLRNVPSPLAGSTWTLHIQSPPEIGAGNFRAYQILPVPVETNRAGYVRQTGLPVGAAELPRAPAVIYSRRRDRDVITANDIAYFYLGRCPHSAGNFRRGLFPVVLITDGRKVGGHFANSNFFACVRFCDSRRAPSHHGEPHRLEFASAALRGSI